ncbi:transcriptional regulator PpsR [Roseibium aquae]|nr:transcriptional regulator PpsR [Roseibium aquae]
MDKAPSKSTHTEFQHSSRLFDGLPAGTALGLVSLGADITLIIALDGKVQDVAFRDEAVSNYRPESWIGQPWRNSVTPECFEKIDALLDECMKTGVSRPHHLNHRHKGLPDLPVEYILAKVDGFDGLLAFGRDLRRFAEIQQQLIQAQFELEGEYRRIREAEARYRIIFQKLDRGVLVVDGDQRRILDGNSSAGMLLGVSQGKLAGESLASLFKKTDRDAIASALGTARDKGIERTIHARRMADDEELVLIIAPYRESGQVNFLLTLHPANTGAQMENGLAYARHDWLDAVPEPGVLTDAKGIVLTVNDRFLDLLHVLSRNQVIGRNINNWLGASNVDMQVLLSRLQDEGEVGLFQSALRDGLGATRPVRLNALMDTAYADPRVVILVNEQNPRDAGQRVRGTPHHTATSDFAELIGRVPLKELIRESADVIEKLCIEAALKQTENNRASAADLLGLSRQSLYIKLKRHGLEDYDGSK